MCMWLLRWDQLCQSAPLASVSWHSSKLAQLLKTQWSFTCDSLEVFGHFSGKKITITHVAELLNFSACFRCRWYLLYVIHYYNISRLTFYKVIDTLLHVLTCTKLLTAIKESLQRCFSTAYSRIGRSFRWDRKNRGTVSQQVWHDKDPSLLKVT
jgi:hypothetical protein